MDDRIKGQVPEHAAYMLLPVHVVYKIRCVDHNIIILSSSVADKIHQLTEQKRVSIRTEILAESSDHIILYKSKDLQIKFKQLQKFPDAFENDTLKRVVD